MTKSSGHKAASGPAARIGRPDEAERESSSIETRATSFLPIIEAVERRAKATGKTVKITGAAYRAAMLVRMMRTTKGLSQAALARRLKMTQARVSEIEAGIGPQGPSWDLMERIAAACDASILVRPPETSIAYDVGEAVDPAHHWELVAASV